MLFHVTILISEINCSLSAVCDEVAKSNVNICPLNLHQLIFNSVIEHQMVDKVVGVPLVVLHWE